ncbi:hypothetical protein PYCC9005_000607 [Savitreella phatthalungensis]
MTSRQILQLVKQLIPPLSEKMHKGQAGRTVVIGGSENYTGAPYYSCMSSMLFGADMGHIICEPGASQVIKTYSPDLIVYPQMRQKVHAAAGETSEQIARGIFPLFDRMHSVVIGPGLGREELMQETAALLIQEIRRRNIPLVVDADGLWLIKNRPELIQGYDNTILTPNVIEFGRLCDAVGLSSQGKPEEKCKELASKLNVTIVQKGAKDYISNGVKTYVVDIEGGLKRCGGQGDVLSGTLGTMLAWKQLYQDKVWDHDNSIDQKEAMLLAAYGACCTTRYCSKTAFAAKGRGMMATDLVASVGQAYHDLFEAEAKL